mgnify:CR=1 FL=1
MPHILIEVRVKPGSRRSVLERQPDATWVAATPLDDANVDRFLNMLKRFGDRFALRAGAIAVYPMYKGLAHLVGMTIVGKAQTLADFENALADLSQLMAKYTRANLIPAKDPDLMPDPEAMGKALREPLLKVFPAALLGRLVTIPYYPLTDENLGKIVRLQLNRIKKRVAEMEEKEAELFRVALDDFHQAPPFGLRQRPGFLDAHAIAGTQVARVALDPPVAPPDDRLRRHEPVQRLDRAQALVVTMDEPVLAARIEALRAQGGLRR